MTNVDGFNNNSNFYNLQRFLQYDKEFQKELILQEFLNSRIHEFTEKPNYPLGNLVDVTLDSIIAYARYGKDNPILIHGEDIKAYFSPEEKHIKRVGFIPALINYFGHIVSVGEPKNNNIRFYEPNKANSISHWFSILNAPERKFAQYYKLKLNAVCIKNIGVKDKYACFILTDEFISENLLRVHTILPNQTKSAIKDKTVKEIDWVKRKMSKKLNQYLVIHSFHQLRALASSSRDSCWKKDALTSKTDTNIQQNSELPNNSEKKSDGGGISDKILSASSRFRPYETIVFEKPIIGANGARLISYTWAYEWQEDFNERVGEAVSKRVSDWTKAEQNAETGRNVVHQFTVELPNGEVKTVSSESVLVLLGYTDKEQMKSFPSLVNALKTLAKQRMQLSIMEAKEREYDEALKNILQQEKPPIIEKEYKQGDSYGGVTIYGMGDAQVWQNDEAAYDEKEKKSVYTKLGHISEERKKSLIDSWIRGELQKLGVANQHGIYDLKNRIKRQEAKVEQLTGGSIKLKMEQGGEANPKKHNMTQQEFDDKIYVAGRKAEDFLIEKYKEHDFGNEIEKFIDNKEETLHSLTDNPIKFETFFQDFDNIEKVDEDFKIYIKHSYPSFKFEEGGKVEVEKPKLKVVIHNKTNSVYDKAAQRLIIEYLKAINDSGRKKFLEFLNKTGQNYKEYETAFYLNHEYHNPHLDKFYSNKLIYRKTIEEAYNDALRADDEHPSFIRIWQKDNVVNYIAAPETDLFGDYSGDMYDEQGYLKQEVKDIAVGLLIAELSPIGSSFDDGGTIVMKSNVYCNSRVEAMLDSDMIERLKPEAKRMALEIEKEEREAMYGKSIMPYNNDKMFSIGGDLKSIQYGDYVTFINDSKEKNPSGSLYYKVGDGGNVKNIYEKDGNVFYTVTRGMTEIKDVPASDVVLYKKDVREKVEQILTERQEKKGFKDIGKRVSGSQKEKITLNKIINLSDLTTIEEDEITAIKTVVKERVYPELNIEEQKTLGVTSGAAYIKIETRKSCGNTPPNDKKKRASYVKFINKFTSDTLNAKTVAEVKAIYDSYEKWTPSEIIGYFIDTSFLESSDEVKSKLEKWFGEKFRYSGYMVVRKLVEEIFGKRFSNFMFRMSDSARQTWHEALSLEPISKEESELLIEKEKERKLKFIAANQEKLDSFVNADVETLKKEMFNFSFGDVWKKLFKEDIENFRKWAINYYQKRVEEGVKSLSVKNESIQQRENNWAWYDVSPEKRVIEKSKEIQINSGKPLAFIKRTGGVKISDEYVDLTKETDLTKNPITKDFGFKTVQFGQSLQDKSAREHIRHFLGAMSDLSEILGIDIKSLNGIGGLSIAFAARGKGKAMASYERGRSIINITNKRGDGTINHEYFHYIDNALTMIGKEGISLVMATEEPEKVLNKNVADRIKAIIDFIHKGKFGITVPVKVLFKKEGRSYSSAPSFYSSKYGSKKLEILDTIESTIEKLRLEYPDILSMNTKYPEYQKTFFGYIIHSFGLNEYEFSLSLNTSNYFNGSAQLQSPYWVKNAELFARASETYIYDKLIKMGRFNNYLVNDDMFAEVRLNNGKSVNVYPYGAERDYLYGLYDDLINTMKLEYNLSTFVPVAESREDEYLVLEAHQEVDENVDAGVIVDAKTDVVEEIIHDNIVVEEKLIEKVEAPIKENNIKIFNYYIFKQGDSSPIKQGKVDRRLYLLDEKYYYQELPKYKLSAEWNRDALNGYDSLKDAVQGAFPTDLGQSGLYYDSNWKEFNPKNILSRYIVLEATQKDTKEKTFIVLLKITHEQSNEIKYSYGQFEKRLESKEIEGGYVFNDVTKEAKEIHYQEQIEQKTNPKYKNKIKQDATCEWFSNRGLNPSKRVAPTIKSKYHSFYYYEKGGKWIPVDDYKTKWIDRDIVVVYINDKDNSKIESIYKEAGKNRSGSNSIEICFYWSNAEHMTPIQYIRAKEELEKISLEKMKVAPKVKVEKKEQEVELTKKDYQEAIESVLPMLELTEGKEKQDLIEYLDSLKTMVELSEK